MRFPILLWFTTHKAGTSANKDTMWRLTKDDNEGCLAAFLAKHLDPLAVRPRQRYDSETLTVLISKWKSHFGCDKKSGDVNKTKCRTVERFFFGAHNCSFSSPGSVSRIFEIISDQNF